MDTLVHSKWLKDYEHLDGLGSCYCSDWDMFFFPSSAAEDQGAIGFPRSWAEFRARHKLKSQDDPNKEKILTIFRLQESRILNQGSDKTELFRPLRERIAVLRGAVFSGFILFLIGLFGCIAPVPDEPFRWRSAQLKKRRWQFVLVGCLFLFALYNGVQDLKHPNIFDMPVLEGVLGLITLFGGFLVCYGVKPRPYLKFRFLLLVGCFLMLAYGGWMWSEVIYDQQVINSYAVSQTIAESARP
jgi:hypothetical protein